MRQDRRLLPPAYFLLAVAGMVLLHVLLPGFRWLAWPWRVMGAAPIAAGAWLNIVGDRQFRRRGTTVRPFHTSSALVTDGAYRYSRNPMYLGMVLILAGTWIILGSLTPLIIVPLFAWWITVKFIREEEQDLAKQFDHEYIEYKSRVRRWL